jgi:predicted Rossmann-fold nucleotide-binding protein
VVVFGSARFVDPETAQQRLAEAEASGDAARIALAKRDVRNARHYDLARQFSRLVAQYSNGKPSRTPVHLHRRRPRHHGSGQPRRARHGRHERGPEHRPAPRAKRQPVHHAVAKLQVPLLRAAQDALHDARQGAGGLPGGFGTLDELFEVLTLVQTGKAKPVPIVLFGTAFWKKLINFEALVEEGTISPQDLGLFLYTDDPQEAWDFIKGFYGL